MLRLAAPSPGPPALAFLIIPLGDMLIFSILIGLALYFRRKLHVHKRLMLLAAINLLTPAIARIPLRLHHQRWTTRVLWSD